MMTLEELNMKVNELLPLAVIEEDLEGQLVIYTGLCVDEDENIQAFES